MHFCFLRGGGERLFEAGRLLTFPTYRVGAYSKWALNRINTVFKALRGTPLFKIFGSTPPGNSA